MNKKLLSMLLSVSMIAASLPSVYAQNTSEQENVYAEPVRTYVSRMAKKTAQHAEAEEVVDADVYSEAELFATEVTVDVENFTVKYNAETLTLSVTKYNGTDTVVEIPEKFTIDGADYTVTSVVGFNGNKTVTSITLPETVKTIGTYAFYNCEALEKVNIPSAVTTIGNYAFRNCAALKKAVVPKGVVSIGIQAFNKCTALEYIYFEGDVPTIASKAFGSMNYETTVFYCNLSKEDSFESNESFSELGIDFETVDDYYVIEKGILTGFNPAVDGETPRDIISIPGYIIDESMPVTEVAENAFDGISGIKTVVVPENVVLNFNAFPDGVTTVYFRGEAPEKEIALSSSASICTTPANEKTFAESAYWGTFTRKTYDDSFEFDTRIGEITGYLKESSKDELSIEIPADIYGVPVEIIGGGVFAGYQYIESVTIPDSVKLIDSQAFAECKNLYAINANTNEKDENVLNVPFIGEGVFYGCESLEQLTLNNLCLLGEAAFFNCRGLSKMEINGDENFVFGETLKNPFIVYLAAMLAYPFEEYPDYYNTRGAIIGADAFCGNYKAGSNATATSGVAPSLRNGVTLTNIGFIDEFAFNGTDIKEIVIPKGVKKIGRAAFAFCEELERVSLPLDLEVIESGANYKPGNENRELACDGAFAFDTALLDITIPDTVTDIGALTFAGSGITEIVLSENLTQIPIGTFKACTNLETVTIPEKVTSINNAAKVDFGSFAGCTALKKVTTPVALETIGAFAFSGCSALKTIADANGTVSGNLKTIGTQAFDGCTKLASQAEGALPLWLPDTVTTIGEKAFQKCSGLILKDGALPKDLTTLGETAFYYCTSLTEAKIPAGLTQISGSAFKSSGLEKVEIPATVTTIGKSAYDACTSLKELTAVAPETEEDTTLTIMDTAFQKCTALENVTFERQTVSLSKSVFNACSALKNFNVDKVLDITIGEKCFADCTALTKTGLRNDIKTSFGTQAYTESGLVEFTAPDNVISIPMGMFYNCKSLENVVLHDNIASIAGDKSKKGAFESCTALKTIKLPANLVTIESYAFKASGLESIELPDSVTVINPATFINCKSLENVKLGNATTTIGGSTDYKDTDLSTATSLSESKIYGAFQGCTALKSIELPESIEKINSFAFAYSGIEKFKYPDGFDAVSDGVFYGCSGLTDITLNEDLTKIGRFSFANCTSLRELEIPRAVTLVSTRAFMNDTALETVRIGDVEGKAVVTLESAAFNNCISLEYIIFSGLLPEYNSALFGSAEIKPIILYFTRFFDESDDDDAEWAENFTMIAIDKQFSYSETNEGECNIDKYTGNLPIAIIPGVVLDENGNSMTVTGINDGAFSGTSVTEISLPRAVSGLNNKAFDGADKLEKLLISAQNENYKTVDGVLYNKNGNTLIYCPMNKTGVFNVGEGVTTVETGAFSGNSLDAITADTANKYYSSADGVLMSKTGDTIVAYPNEKGASYTVPATVTAIEDYAFTNSEMVLTFDGTTAPTASENAIVNGITIKIYPDATGFDSTAYSGLAVLYISKPVIDKAEQLADGTINVTYHNYNTDAVSAKVFVALYANGALVEVTAAEDISLATGEEVVKNYSFAQQGDTVKVFMWNSWEEMVPVEDAKIYNIQ